MGITSQISNRMFNRQRRLGGLFITARAAEIAAGQADPDAVPDAAPRRNRSRPTLARRMRQATPAIMIVGISGAAL